jgi:signal transduction histidine kinase
MSHELRTPLNAIIGFSDLVLKKTYGPLGDARYSAYVGDIHAAGGHLLSIINSILDLTKIELGRMSLHHVQIAPAELVRETARLFQPELDARKIDLRLHFATDLPLVTIDAAKLKQCLLNLLSNAIKFSADGSLIEISCKRRAGDRYRFEVTDRGIGMSPDQIPIALSPFGQVDSSLARKFEGTGLGLPLAQRLSELMGGVLEINSVPGQGTTVSITVPDAGLPQQAAAIAAVG